MQSKGWEFDLVVHQPHTAENEHIAGEVKKSVVEFQEMIENLHDSCQGPEDRSEDGMQSAQKNAHRKYRGLLRRRANYFLAAGPAGLARLFEVDYGHDGIVRLNEAPHERLRYTNQ